MGEGGGVEGSVGLGPVKLVVRNMIDRIVLMREAEPRFVTILCLSLEVGRQLARMISCSALLISLVPF